MKEIKGLSFERNKLYQAAIQAGYFDGYEAAPRDWNHSFVGTFLLKWPKRKKTLDRIREITGHVPEWEDLTDDVIGDFVLDLQDDEVTASTAKTLCAELKAVLNRNRRKVPSTEFADMLRIKSETSQAVYLTREEITRIMDYPVVGDIERFVRRNFVVECLTGARLCDAERLSIDNCDMTTGTLSYVPDKTPGIIVTLPVDEGMRLRDFLSDRYTRPCGVNVFNDAVRRICKNCGIDEQKTVFRHGQTVTEKKYMLVSSHTGRRSFATNLYVAGVSLEDIAMMMGHGKNIETTKRYICAERRLTPDIMSYFQPREHVDYNMGELA